MHVNDIKALAARTAADKAFAGKKVVVRAPAGKGKYLSRRGTFDAERADAYVYDYDKDRVGDQLFQCLMAGMPVEVEPA